MHTRGILGIHGGLFFVFTVPTSCMTSCMSKFMFLPPVHQINELLKGTCELLGNASVQPAMRLQGFSSGSTEPEVQEELSSSGFVALWLWWGGVDVGGRGWTWGGCEEGGR